MTFFRLLLVLLLASPAAAWARHPPSPRPKTCQKAVCTPLSHVHTTPLIVIDPGHGGKDLGAVSPGHPVYSEKNLNLASARMLEGFLRHKGYRTLMTRSDDTFLSLDERTDFVKAKDADLFVSVHYNSAPNHSAEGIEVFYYESDKEKERTKASQAMAQAVLDKVIANTNAKSRGVKHGNYAVIRNSVTPAILIEGGFMTNEAEMDHLKDPAYLKKLAWGVAQGIDEFVKKRS